jgi:hypothetical protein
MNEVAIDPSKGPKEYKFLSVDVTKTTSSFVILKVAKDLDVTFHELQTKYRHIIDSECDAIGTYEWDDDGDIYEIEGMSEVAEEYAQGFIKEDSVATIG